jgi:hypothetical protein
MPQELKTPHPSALSSVIENCLPKLQAISLALDTYGNEDQAAKLHEVIAQLQRAVPAQAGPVPDSMDFIVNATFKVTRQQVANTLWHAFTGALTWFKVAQKVVPRELRFRSIDQINPGIVDYPLNEGGVVRIVTINAPTQILELRLEGVAQGLEVVAKYYPRHFADLVNENGDAITANVLLQSCLFGEVIFG